MDSSEHIQIGAKPSRALLGYLAHALSATWRVFRMRGLDVDAAHCAQPPLPPPQFGLPLAGRTVAGGRSVVSEWAKRRWAMPRECEGCDWSRTTWCSVRDRLIGTDASLPCISEDTELAEAKAEGMIASAPMEKAAHQD